MQRKYSTLVPTSRVPILQSDKALWAHKLAERVPILQSDLPPLGRTSYLGSFPPFMDFFGNNLAALEGCQMPTVARTRELELILNAQSQAIDRASYKGYSSLTLLNKR